MDKYEILEKIGKGSYGLVFKGRVKATGQIVALKKTRTRYAEEGIPTSALREIANLKLLARGKNIIKLLAVEIEQYDRQLTVYLVFEFMDYDLLNLYYRYKINDASVPLVIIKNLMYQLLKGVEYCHKHGVIHRDLKPQNLLLNIDAGLLKVADMGLGRVQRKKDMSYSLQVASLWYKPPELLLGDLHYSFPLDIWAVGCIFAELWNMNPLFKGDSDYDQIILIFRMLGTPNEEVWPGVSELKHWSSQFPKFQPKDLRDFVPGLNECAFDLLSKMLQNDPSKRISARKALSHPYFSNLDEET